MDIHLVFYNELDEGSTSMIRIHNMIVNTSYNTYRGVLFPFAETEHHGTLVWEYCKTIPWEQTCPSTKENNREIV